MRDLDHILGNNMKTLFSFVLLMVSFSASADGYGPYNQAFTMNQQYSAGNWYSSPLGQGVAVAGVTLIGGLVNAMSRPDPVVVPQQQPIYVNGGQGNGGQQNCQARTIVDQQGQPHYVQECQ